VLTKLQIAFCVVAGLGVSVFGIGMIAAEKQQAQPQNVNAAKVPGWLAPVAWGSFGLIVASCAGVVVTLALDREKEPGIDGEDEDEEELLPVDEASSAEPETVPDLTTVEDTSSETTEAVHSVPAEMEFTEPGTEETIEFSTLPTEDDSVE